MEPTNDHEREIARSIDEKEPSARGKLDSSIVRDVAVSLDFVMSRSDSQFLVRYVQWRITHPTSD